jgi:hypothetical protein
MASFPEKITTSILARIRARREPNYPGGSRPLAPTAVVAPAKLREVTFADFQEVAKLKERTGLAADSVENWDRLWRRNPALLASNTPHPMGWVLEANGGVVGYMGTIPLQCRYGNRTLNAVTSHGFAVDVPYRAVAVSLAAAFYRQKSVDLFLSTSAIEASGKIALAFRCSTLPQPDYDTVLFWVLRPYAFAKGLMKKLDVRPLLAPAGGVLAALAVGSDKALRSRRPAQIKITRSVREAGLEFIGHDFAEFWTSKLLETPGTPRIFADRTPAALRWHFEIPGDRGSVRVLCCHKDGRLDGYAVVRNDIDPESGIRRSIIADMIALGDDESVIQSLWVAAYQSAERAGSDILEVQGFPPHIRAMSSKWLPYQRKYPAHPYYFKATDPKLHAELGHGEAWYACPFDGDATLIRPSYSNPAVPLNLARQEELAAQSSLAFPPPATERTEVC